MTVIIFSAPRERRKMMMMAPSARSGAGALAPAAPPARAVCGSANEGGGGERGIRTLDRVSPIHAFQACAFNHSAISPGLRGTGFAGRFVRDKFSLTRASLATRRAGYHQSMSVRYREHAPPERLRASVECFWSLAPGEAVPQYPVLPDGCVDIVYSRSAGPQVVGTMTSVRRFTLEAEQFQIGVRFRPGMAPGFVRVPGSQTTDRLLSLDDLWGVQGRQFHERIANAESAEHCIGLLEAQLADETEPNAVQKISAYIVDRSGQVRVDDLAFDAGMSARQLRRIFLEQLGLSPKHFCRVIRFRHSLPKLRAADRGDWTQVALDCGYYDQAHFINEFRGFSGYTPGEFATLPR